MKPYLERGTMKLLISRSAQFERIEIDARRWEVRTLSSLRYPICLRFAKHDDLSENRHREKRARVASRVRAILFATAYRACPTTGVLTVFCLDRVERGPCQIPASWLWLRFIVKVISTINYPTVKRRRARLCMCLRPNPLLFRRRRKWMD